MRIIISTNLRIYVSTESQESALINIFEYFILCRYLKIFISTNLWIYVYTEFQKFVLIKRVNLLETHCSRNNLRNLGSDGSGLVRKRPENYLIQNKKLIFLHSKKWFFIIIILIWIESYYFKLKNSGLNISIQSIFIELCLININKI